MKETPDIDMQTLLAEWETAKKNTERYTNDFPSLDNIVDGIPINHQAGSPYVGDTTLAGLVRSIPRASLQQLPVFIAIINGSKNSINALLASFLLRKGVFNQDTFGKGLLSTMQMGAEQSLNHGYAPFFTATGSLYDDFGTTMKLLHYADCASEPGIQDANESGYFYINANVPKSRMIKIRNAARNNPNTTWNLKALDRLLESEPVGPRYSFRQSDARNRGGFSQMTSGYQIGTRYESGRGGQFITFSAQVEDMPLRVMPNKSKFGYPRVQYLVIDPAPLSPHGISRVRLASPNQNLMNAYYQNVASMFILNSKPPLLKRGRFTKPVQLKQGAIWEALDQNASVELKEMSNGTLQQFVPMAQQMASQIQNIMGTPVGTSSGGTNTMGYSKTAPGVKMQQTSMDRATDQITHIMENFLRQYALVALDTLISEQVSDDPLSPNISELIVDDEAKNAINRVQPGAIGDDNSFTIEWNAFYDHIKTWSIEIELSMGKNELDEKKRGDLQDMLTVLLQNSQALGPETQQRAMELLDMLMEKSVPESKRFTSSVSPQVPPENQQLTTQTQPSMM